MSPDIRGWRVALVPEFLINPPARAVNRLPDILRVLESTGYGMLQLPPEGEHGLLLGVIADQVAEYAHHGYAVAAIGVKGQPGNGLHWRRLAPLLRNRGVALPPRHIVRPEAAVPTETQRLEKFLSEYDLPEDERRRWRV